MTEPIQNFDPSTLPPRRHKRDVVSDITWQPCEPSPVSAPAGTPFRWNRLGSQRTLWLALQRINTSHRVRVWRRRIIIGLVVVVVLSLIGLGIAKFWFGIDFSSQAAIAHQAGAFGTVNDGAEADPLAELRKLVLPTLVDVKHGDQHGTGFISDDGFVVTTDDAAPQGENLSVTYQDGEVAAVTERVAFDKERGLVVLRTDTKNWRRMLKLTASPSKSETQVAAFELGKGELQGLVTGISQCTLPGGAASREVLQTTLSAVSGWSGGPVVNKVGEVVGVMICSHGSRPEVRESMLVTRSVVVSVSALKPLLAIASLGEKIRSEPSDLSYRRSRATLYLDNGDLSKAIEDYASLIGLEPGDANTHFRRGKAYVEMGELELAIDDFTKVIGLNTKDPDAYCARGAVYARRNKFEKAFADFMNAFRINFARRKAANDRPPATKAETNAVKTEKLCIADAEHLARRSNPDPTEKCCANSDASLALAVLQAK